jgi:glycerol-3-phosphate acyltransferase PlsY
MPEFQIILGSATNWSRTAGLVLGSYLLGCVTTGYYLVRWRTGKDLRGLGSASLGAKNVGRILGPTGFAATMLIDTAKGAVAVLAAQHWSGNPDVALTCLLAVVAGHIWPCQLGFHGGKGMATALGAVGLYDFRLVLVGLAVFALAIPLVRRTALSGLIGFAAVPAGAWLFHLGTAPTLGLLALVALVLFAHRQNLADGFAAFRSPPPENRD